MKSPSDFINPNAALAHLVERNLAKVEVASSSLVSRSILNKKSIECYRLLICFYGVIAVCVNGTPRTAPPQMDI